MEQSFDALMRVERIGVRELGELRDVIEIQTAGWAAERRTTEELEALYGCLRWEESHVSNTRLFLMAGGERPDIGFHILMAKAAHNDFALMIERVTYMNVRKYVEKEVMRFPIKEQAAICRQIFEKHARVITAIAEQDKEKAMDEMRQRTVPFASDEYIEDYMDR
ncbi:MAG: FCD domain-containing protein [Eubacteriales bacterium]|nr:FCD domain-containing protein [Eubacteriales bacterium]